MRRGWFVVIFVLFLSSCDDRDSKPAEPPSPIKVSEAQPFVTITISDPKTFNPLLVVDQGSGEALEPLFEGLVRTSPATLETEPVLAERWEHDESGTVWTFHLRKDVRWQDGTPFTAADVEFTFRATFDERVPNSSKYVLMVDSKPISVTAIDEHTVKVQTARPFAPLLSALEQPILPAHLLAKPLADGTFVRHWGVDVAPDKIVGTGPFRMVRYVPAQFIQYERNPLYWKKDSTGAALPYLERRTVLIVPDQNTAYLKF